LLKEVRKREGRDRGGKEEGEGKRGKEGSGGKVEG
jgi:hypothetical protein